MAAHFWHHCTFAFVLAAGEAAALGATRVVTLAAVGACAPHPVQNFAVICLRHCVQKVILGAAAEGAAAGALEGAAAMEVRKEQSRNLKSCLQQ